MNNDVGEIVGVDLGGVVAATGTTWGSVAAGSVGQDAVGKGAAGVTLVTM